MPYVVHRARVDGFRLRSFNRHDDTRIEHQPAAHFIVGPQSTETTARSLLGPGVGGYPNSSATHPNAPCAGPPNDTAHTLLSCGTGSPSPIRCVKPTFRSSDTPPNSRLEIRTMPTSVVPVPALDAVEPVGNLMLGKTARVQRPARARLGATSRRRGDRRQRRGDRVSEQSVSAVRVACGASSRSWRRAALSHHVRDRRIDRTRRRLRSQSIEAQPSTRVSQQRAARVGRREDWTPLSARRRPLVERRTPAGPAASSCSVTRRLSSLLSPVVCSATVLSEIALTPGTKNTLRP